MQCVLTLAVAAVVTASHRDLQGKPHHWHCFPFSFPLVLPLCLQYPAFPWPRRSHHQRWISLYNYHFIYHLHMVETGKCYFTTKNSLVNGRFPSHPLQHRLPPCTPLLCTKLLPMSPPCRGTAGAGSHPLPHPGVLLPGPPTHSPLPWECSSPIGITHPWLLREQAAHARLAAWTWGVWKWALHWQWHSRRHIHKGNSTRDALLLRCQQRTGKGLRVGFGATEKTE